MSKKKKKSPDIVLTTQGGEKFKVTETRGKYYICNGTQFRMSSPSIIKIEREVTEDADC